MRPALYRHCRVFRHILPPRHTHETTENRVAIAADNHVAAVPASVRIGRHNPCYGCARGLTHNTCTVVFRHQSLHEIEYRFVECDIDGLPAVIPVPLNHRQGDAECRMNGRPVSPREMLRRTGGFPGSPLT